MSGINLALLGSLLSSGRAFVPVIPGQQAFTSPGTYSWIAPAGVTQVCVLCVGGGGGGSSSNGSGGAGGGGGGLAWKNNIPVVPGQSYTVVVGNIGIRSTSTGSTSTGSNGGDSYFISPETIVGRGGRGATSATVGGAGGTFTANTITYTLETSTTYTVSSTYSTNSPPTYQYMNDNNANGSTNGNQWGSNNETNPFIRADIGSIKQVGRIIVGYDYLSNLPGGWGTSYTEGLSVQTSTDGSSWTTRATTPTYASSGSTNGLVTINFTPVDARYVRLTKASGFMAALEFQVFNAIVDTISTGGGGNGGSGGNAGSTSAGGGGGAGGYTGNGGNGGSTGAAGANGAGGGGGGGGAGGSSDAGGGGGGVGILGQGTNGVGGTYTGADAGGGTGGSGGSNGVTGGSILLPTNGGVYGGGGAGAELNNEHGDGGPGAVRIIWGDGFSYPSAAGTAAKDASFSNVILLLHGDGANGSTTITDSSATPKTATATNTSINTLLKKFGTGSIYFGTGNNGYVSLASELTFTGDVTIEFWAYITAGSPSGQSIGTSSTTVNSQIPYLYSDGRIGYYNNGANFLTAAGKFSLNTWFHCAVVRSSGVARIYINGVDTGSSVADTGTVYIKNISGFNGGASGYNIIGYFDDVRISNIARYTANFTPTTEAFPDSA